MKSIIFYILNIFIFMQYGVFSQDTTYFDAGWEECARENSVYYRIDQKAGDKFLRTDYFAENNQVQMKAFCLSLEPEIKTGYVEWFHPNGQLRHSGFYDYNKEQGKHIWYYDNGNIEAVEHYKDGVPDSIYLEYYPNGNPMSETYFSGGYQNGYTKQYYSNNQVSAEGNMKDGRFSGKWIFYDESGELTGERIYKTDYVLPDAGISFRLPGPDWYLAEKKEGTQTNYIFKRLSVFNSEGGEIIPAIVLVYEDASSYKNDVVEFSIDKRLPFLSSGIKINETLIHENDAYPLSITNGLFMKCSYDDDVSEHLLFMAHLITNNTGIQIYFDTTADIADQIENEFLIMIKSISEIDK